MQFLYRNVAVIHVFAVCAAFAWLFGGTKPDSLLAVMPWVTAFMLEAMVCFPQQHEGEPMFDARERVWRAMRKDPLVWTTLGMVLLLVIPFFNTGLCPVCDYPEIQAGADPSPTLPFFPFCVNRMHHLDVVLWFVPTLAAVVAAKHALLKKGKRTLLAMIVWNGLALGVLGAVQQMTMANGPLWTEDFRNGVYFFSTFGYPNMAGDYFTTLFGIAVGLWRWNLEEIRREELAAAAEHAELEAESERRAGHHVHTFSRRASTVSFWKRHYYLIPAVIFFFCALDTLSRAAVMSVTTLAIVFFFHSILCFFKRMRRIQRVKAGVASAVVFALVALCAVVFMPDDIQREVDTIETTGVLDRVTGKGQYHVRVATEIWKDHLLFGVGGWGYKHFCLQKMTDKELRHVQSVGGANVHNDHLQFLVEHGAVGVALLAAVVVMLLSPVFKVWKGLVESVRFVPVKEQPPQPVQLFAVPAPVFCILLTSASTFIHAFGDCPLRSPAVLSLFFVSLASLDGFLPKLKERRR